MDGAGADGAYTVKVGVFGGSWNPLYYWANAAAAIAVGSGSPPATATVPPATATQARATATIPPATATQVPSATATTTPLPTVGAHLPAATATITGAGTRMSFAQQTSAMPAVTVPNGSVSIRTMVINTGGALINGTVNVGVYSAAGQQVGQQLFNVQSLGAGQSALYTWAWRAAAQSGAYTVRVGVYGPSSSTPYYSANSAALIMVPGAARPAAAVSPAQTARPRHERPRRQPPPGCRRTGPRSPRSQRSHPGV